MPEQLNFFADETPSLELPSGFKFAHELITLEDERFLLEHFRTLPFKEFEFHGYTGKRRTVSFGVLYDFSTESLRPAEPMPDFLEPVRETAAAFAGCSAAALRQALISEYAAGAGIGWHRDKAVFGDVIGISLLAPCKFRLRRRAGDTWERVTLEAEPRSAYLFSGPSRTEWEHSIPEVDALRYSITFRTMRDRTAS